MSAKPKPDGLELVRLLYAPSEATALHALPYHVTRNLAKALAYAVGVLFTVFPEEVREAYRRGVQDGRKQGGQT